MRFDKQMPVHIDAETHREMTEIKEKTGVSFQFMARTALRRYVEDFKKTHVNPTKGRNAT